MVVRDHEAVFFERPELDTPASNIIDDRYTFGWSVFSRIAAFPAS